MSLEDEVNKLMWDAVRASQPALEADMKGGEHDATHDELFGLLIDRRNGIAEAVRRLATRDGPASPRLVETRKDGV